MSDIFVSYSSHDKKRVRPIVDALVHQGWTVWWDETIAVGQSFDNTIQRELDDARCILVVWSKDSIDSEWVKNEAMEGARRSCLIPVLIDDVTIPIAFRRIQTADLTSWGLNTKSYTDVINGVSEILGSEPASSEYVRGHQRRRLGLAAAILVATLSAIYIAYSILPIVPSGSNKTAVTAQPPSWTPIKNSIAVLKFIDMSRAGDQRDIAEGISEEILNALSEFGALRVIARTSSFRFDSEDSSIRDIGQQLNVQHVLEGSVRSSGDMVRVTAQLINAENEFHVWSRSYDKELSDVFSIYDEVSSDIAESLAVMLVDEKTEKSTVRRPTSDVVAYQLFLKASYIGYSIGDYSAALDLLEDVLQRDPKFAKAHLLKGRINWVLASIGVIRAGVGYSAAKQSADTALEIDDSLFQGYELLGEIEMETALDFRKANDLFSKANQLTHSPLRGQGLLFYFLGLYEEARLIFARIEEINPYEIYNKIALGDTLSSLGRKDEATLKFEDALEIGPNNVFVMVSSAVHFATELHDYDRASALLDFDLQKAPGREAEVLWGRGVVHIEMGDRDAAQQTISQLLELRKTQYVSPLFIQDLYWRIGDVESHIKWVGVQIEERASLAWLKPFFNETPGYWNTLSKWALSDPDEAQNRMTSLNEYRFEVERITRKMTL